MSEEVRESRESEDINQQFSPSQSMKPIFHRVITLMKMCGIYNDLLFTVRKSGFSLKCKTPSTVLHLVYCTIICLLLLLNSVRMIYYTYDKYNDGLSSELISTIGTTVLYIMFSYIAIGLLWTLSGELKPLVEKLERYEETHGWVFNTKKVKRTFVFAMSLTLIFMVCSNIFYLGSITGSYQMLPNIRNVFTFSIFGVEETELINFKIVWVFSNSVIIVFTNIVPFGTYCLFSFVLYFEFKSLGTDYKYREDFNIYKTASIRDVKCRFEELLKVVWAFDSCMRHIIAVPYVGIVIIICLTVYSHVLGGKQSVLEIVPVLGYLGIIFICVCIITMAAVLLNKKIHEPLNALHQLDISRLSDRDVQELSIFMSRLSGQSIGLTMYGLFVLDQSSILTILGTLLTYIIVMLQFKPAQDTGRETNVLLEMLLSKLNDTDVRLHDTMNGSVIRGQSHKTFSTNVVE